MTVRIISSVQKIQYMNMGIIYWNKYRKVYQPIDKNVIIIRSNNE